MGYIKNIHFTIRTTNMIRYFTSLYTKMSSWWFFLVIWNQEIWVHDTNNFALIHSDVTNTVSSYSSSSSNLPTSHSKSVTSPTSANATGRSKSETQSEPVDFSSNPPLSSLSAAAAARSSGFADTCSTADNLARYRSSAASGMLYSEYWCWGKWYTII